MATGLCKSVSTPTISAGRAAVIWNCCSYSCVHAARGDRLILLKKEILFGKMIWRRRYAGIFDSLETSGSRSAFHLSFCWTCCGSWRKTTPKSFHFPSPEVLLQRLGFFLSSLHLFSKNPEMAKPLSSSLFACK